MSENGQIPMVLIHGAWLSARRWENYYSWLDGILDAPMQPPRAN